MTMHTLRQRLAVYIFEITMAIYTMALAQQLALLFAGREQKKPTPLHAYHML
jgi:hypothetical protein